LPFKYVSVDISPSYQELSHRRIRKRFPTIDFISLTADYSLPLQYPKELLEAPNQRLMYFPGSTIGNLEPAEAVELLQKMKREAGLNGLILVGVDTKKEEAILNSAYNDMQGFTALFNLNVLSTLNRRWRGNFQPGRFEHLAFYNADLGRVEMHLCTFERHAFTLGGDLFRMEPGETIRTEISYKYTPSEFVELANEAGLTCVKHWTDEKEWFALYLLY
jgi:dimethylhistidine N-methyltransferase